MRLTSLLATAALLVLCACATKVSDDFLPMFGKHNSAHENEFSNIVVSLKYDPDRNHLLVGRESGVVEVWSAGRARLLKAFQAHKHRVSHITPVARGRYLLTDSYFEDDTKMWEAETGTLATVLPKSRVPTFITSNAASGLVAVGTASGTIDLWKFSWKADAPVLERLSSHGPYEVGDWVKGLQVSADASTVIAVARSGKVDEFEIETFAKRRSIPTTLRHVHVAQFIPERMVLALAGTRTPQGLEEPQLEMLSLAGAGSHVVPTNSNLATLTFVAPLESIVATQYGPPLVVRIPFEARP